VQAIAKIDMNPQPTTEQFINYLREVAVKTKGISSVWNLSFNQIIPSDSNDEISHLGHGINSVAREFSILPVISIGNVSKNNITKLCPPADCEAALTISGRQSNRNGDVGGMFGKLTWSSARRYEKTRTIMVLQAKNDWWGCCNGYKF
jgi:hypothetical protein